MGNDFQLAYFRDRAARNRLEGKSGVLSDWIANDIESSERRKERLHQEAREDSAQEAVLDELRAHREFVEDQALAYQEQAEAEQQAFETRKQAMLTLERTTIPDISLSVEALEGRAPHGYYDLVKVWHDLRTADSLYESIDWSFPELKAALADLRKRVKRLFATFKDQPSPDVCLDSVDALLRSANAVGWADNFYWDFEGLVFSSPATLDTALASWRSTTERIEKYASTLHELAKAVEVAKDLGLVVYREDLEIIHFGNAALFQGALGASQSFSPSLKGDEGISSLCWYLYSARSAESILEHLASLYQQRDAAYAPLVIELELQAGLIASLLDNPDSIETALQARPLRFVGVDLIQDVPREFLKNLRFRIGNRLNARREKARAVGEFARKSAAALRESFQDQAFLAHTQGERTSDRKPIADIAATGTSADLSQRSIDAQWDAIKRAAMDNTAGRELVTMLGGMYQARRRNPDEPLTLPKMITSLPNSQHALKTVMTALFNLAKNDDESKLASRSQEIQIVRMAAAAHR